MPVSPDTIDNSAAWAEPTTSVTLVSKPASNVLIFITFLPNETIHEEAGQPAPRLARRSSLKSSPQKRLGSGSNRKAFKAL
ncbi:hypothetical protein GCM10007913_03550 [Devosia yakushimensis]|uniref:Uncharacterized protein n=1 Tax=Devosia yakushimensis TaxID=470028 RepID=A0ABQ5U909_9HYPH|nr:hypothetical protein GCM10007913_03550 [Devosia yakushimensis]